MSGGDSLIIKGVIEFYDYGDHSALWIVEEEEILLCHFLQESEFDGFPVKVRCIIYDSKPDDPDNLDEIRENVVHEGYLNAELSPLNGTEWTGQYGWSETFRLINKKEETIFDFYDLIYENEKKYLILTLSFVD